jgi:hypothetical protein
MAHQATAACTVKATAICLRRAPASSWKANDWLTLLYGLALKCGNGSEQRFSGPNAPETVQQLLPHYNGSTLITPVQSVFSS